ncbi:hypothetical protein [Ethanoligenens sp.]|uniref:hypothetical protein n=1 Tax=Ethanoligenens sp. TaxID=2099655 RepID=UPI0039E8FB54
MKNYNYNRYTEITARVSRKHLQLMGAFGVTRTVEVTNKVSVQGFEMNDCVETVLAVLAQMIVI